MEVGARLRPASPSPAPHEAVEGAATGAVRVAEMVTGRAPDSACTQLQV